MINNDYRNAGDTQKEVKEEKNCIQKRLIFRFLSGSDALKEINILNLFCVLLKSIIIDSTRNGYGVSTRWRLAIALHSVLFRFVFFFFEWNMEYDMRRDEINTFLGPVFWSAQTFVNCEKCQTTRDPRHVLFTLKIMKGRKNENSLRWLRFIQAIDFAMFFTLLLNVWTLVCKITITLQCNRRIWSYFWGQWVDIFTRSEGESNYYLCWYIQHSETKMNFQNKFFCNSFGAFN